MKSKMFQILGVFVLLLSVGVVSGCQTLRPVPSRMYSDHKKFLTYGDYKAMVGAIGARGAYTYGWSYDYGSVGAAIKRATKECESNLQKYSVMADCKIHFVGNTNVRGLSEPDVAAVIADYNKGSAAETPATPSEPIDLSGKADEEICHLAVHSDKWNFKWYPEYVSEAKSRGFTPETCATLVVKKNAEDQSTATSSTIAQEEEETETKPIAVSWGGYSDLMAGIVTFSKANEGDVDIILPSGEGRCAGTFNMQNETHGTWAISCTNGRAASGVFEVVGKTRTGKGKDAYGNEITFTVGG
jgi:hypothetical protein